MNSDQVKYVSFDKNGFLEEGNYDITVEYRNDEKRSKSKILESDNKLLNAYLANKNKITYYPTGEVPHYLANKNKITYYPTGEVPHDLKKPLYTKIASINAYYANWVSEGFSDYINFHNLYFYDNLFLISFLMPSYGLNKDTAWINDSRISMKPATEYTWVTEICNSNEFENLNLSIFQLHQHFKTA